MNKFPNVFNRTSNCIQVTTNIGSEFNPSWVRRIFKAHYQQLIAKRAKHNGMYYFGKSASKYDRHQLWLKNYIVKTLYNNMPEVEGHNRHYHVERLNGVYILYVMYKEKTDD